MIATRAEGWMRSSLRGAIPAVEMSYRYDSIPFHPTPLRPSFAPPL